MKNLLCALLMVIVSGCASVSNQMDVTRYYKMDMKINNRGIRFTGVGVLPRKDLYTIDLYSPGRLSAVMIKTCSRSVILENVGEWYNKKKTSYTYRPNLIEKKNGCDLEIWGLDAKKGRHSLSYIVFDAEDEGGASRLVCGDRTGDYHGASACQGQIGYRQRIEFSEIMTTAPLARCDIGQVVGKVFEFAIMPGVCNYLFMSKSGKIHRLVTYGFEKIMVRD